jgi:hypothetical protein
MSGYAHPVLASQGTLEPGVILIEKPFTESALLGKINDVLATPGDQPGEPPEPSQAGFHRPR